MAEKHTFIISDEKILNSYRFRVMTAEIDIVHFKKNPIVMWYHKRPTNWNSKNGSDEPLPIGKAKKLWKEDGKLYAEIEFDQEDEFAVKIEKKLKGGFLNMCSPGLEPITVSDAAQYLLPGQTRSTLVKSRLEEISIVDRGSNDNALRLYQGGSIVELSAEGENDVIPNINKNQNTMELKNELAPLLGLSADAPDSTFVKKIMEMKSDAGFKGKFETLSKDTKNAEEAQVIALVDANMDKKFTADKRETFITLGKTSGTAVLQTVLASMGDISTRPGDGIEGNGGAPPAEGVYKTFVELAAKGTDEIAKYSKENKANYIVLFKAHYGTEPTFKD